MQTHQPPPPTKKDSKLDSKAYEKLPPDLFEEDGKTFNMAKLKSLSSLLTNLYAFSGNMRDPRYAAALERVKAAGFTAGNIPTEAEVAQLFQTQTDFIKKQSHAKRDAQTTRIIMREL